MNDATKKRKEKWDGNIRTRSNGSYEARIMIDGVSKSFYGKSEAEVKRKMRDYRKNAVNYFRNPSRILLYDYVSKWIIENKLGFIKASSYDKLERVLENQIKNTIGDIEIGKLRTKDIQDLINFYANPPKGNEYKALAVSGLKRIIDLLNPCLKYAVKKGEIEFNPIEDVKIPIQENMLVKTKKQFTLDDKEIEEFKAACLKRNKDGSYKYRYGLFFLVLINTGLRVGELIPLTFDDIHIDKKYIRISKTIEQNVIDRTSKDLKKITLITSPKTERSNRLVRLNENAIFYINEIIEDTERYGIKSDLVFSTSSGSMATERNLLRTLNVILNKTSINKNVTLHTLRHCYGSTMLRRGIEISVVSKLMGHSSTKITYDKYIHTIEELEIDAVEVVNI